MERERKRKEVEAWRAAKEAKEQELQAREGARRASQGAKADEVWFHDRCFRAAWVLAAVLCFFSVVLKWVLPADAGKAAGLGLLCFDPHSTAHTLLFEGVSARGS